MLCLMYGREDSPTLNQYAWVRPRAFLDIMDTYVTRLAQADLLAECIWEFRDGTYFTIGKPISERRYVDLMEEYYRYKKQVRPIGSWPSFLTQSHIILFGKDLE